MRWWLLIAAAAIAVWWLFFRDSGGARRAGAMVDKIAATGRRGFVPVGVGGSQVPGRASGGASVLTFARPPRDGGCGC